MQQVDTTSSPALVPVDWIFLEVWLDPGLPCVLLLLSDQAGYWYVYDPAEQYKVIFASPDYEEAKLWLLEDEYELVRGRLSHAEEYP
ncbi:MAG: hypothetical protein KME35_09765 [Aphanocapsa sp. GSE-SYN-MK-11-07L]|nr:hypothetical protein [Aphanocapsa sp. GSE-SYN-MK-11-07L]